MKRYLRGVLAVVAVPVIVLVGAVLGLLFFGLVEIASRNSDLSMFH